MKFIKLLFLAIMAIAVTGCATPDYGLYAQSQTDIARAKSAAEIAKYQALAKMAESGDSAARVAAVMGLAFQQSQANPQIIAAPRSASDIALQWASILVPSLTQAHSISKNAEVSIAQSNNATALGVSTNSAFVGIAGKIQAPAANVTNSTTSTTATTVGANSGANSGNSGRLAGTSIADNTATPTVVTQPLPVIVRPEVVKVSEVTP